MRVKLVLSFIVVSLISMLAGCGGGTASSTGGTQNPAPALKSIAVSPGSSTVQVLKTQQFKATGTYSDGSSKDITSSVAWSSSSTAIATISNSGLATLVGGGTVTIQATSASVKGSTTLTVTDTLVSISVHSTASSVNVASTLQLTALGTYQDGKPASALSGVTWTSSDPAKATVDSNGVVSGLKGGQVTITASSGSLSGKSQLGVIALLQTISVNPVGNAILVGGGQTFTATGIFNDGSTQDFTATANWTVSDQTKGSVSANQVSGVAAGPITVTATANGVSGSTALNIVSSVYANLSGNYTFSLTAEDARGPDFVAGAIFADGSGNITGVEDSNTMHGVNANVALTGTYVVYPDGRGNLKINANACHPAGLTLRFILYSGGTMGKLAQFDGRGTAKGALVQQNSAAFTNAAINGSYVFRASGIDSGNNSAAPQGLGEVGLFVADGTGAISSGVMDINDYSVFYGQVPLTASSYSIGANGRGTMQFITASGTTNFAVYVIDANTMNLVQIDSAPASVLSGVAELQTNTLYDASAFNGHFSLLLDGPVWQSGSAIQYAQMGQYNLDGFGAMSGLRDQVAITGQYEADGTVVNGRGQMHIYAVSDNRIDFFYAVSPTKLFALQSFTLPTIFSSNPATGEMILQTGLPYSPATLAGNYVVDASDLAVSSANLIWMTLDGAGNMLGIADTAQNGSVSSSVISNATYTTNSTTASGYGTMQMTSSTGTYAYNFYLVSPKGGWLVATSPLLDGSLNQQ